MPEGSPFASWGRILIAAGIFIIVLGVIMLLFDRLGFLGRLPGDIVIRRKGWSLWIPITTSIVLSIILTIIFNLIRR